MIWFSSPAMFEDEAILIFAEDLSTKGLDLPAETIGARASPVTLDMCEDSLEALCVWLMVSLRIAALVLSFLSAILPLFSSGCWLGFIGSSVM